jgi:peroxiredoxin
MNKIQIGDIIPSFTLKDQNGVDFDIYSLLGRKKLVIAC